MLKEIQFSLMFVFRKEVACAEQGLKCVKLVGNRMIVLYLGPSTSNLEYLV